MPFCPYHRFRNRKPLESLIEKIKAAGNITDEAYSSFHRYHTAMIHKLRSAKYHLESLEEKLSTTDLSEAANPSSSFMFEVNMFIDGFFYNAGSSMDILARVVLTLFGQPLTGDIYFQTAYRKIQSVRLCDPILPKLESPSWRKAFSDYRNTLTHELILAQMWQISIDNTGAAPETRIVFPLPDDPHAALDERRYRRNPDVVAYEKSQFTRLLSLDNIIYGELVARASAKGSLPI